MIVDSSAILAVLLGESDAGAFAQRMEQAEVLRISAGNFLETAIIVDRNRDPVLSNRFDDFITLAGIAIEAVTESHVLLGRQAYRDFGRRSGHPAQLNFGDCFAYALAKATGEPLLFKGNDFSTTDIESAFEAS